MDYINKCITAAWDEFSRGNITATQLLRILKFKYLGCIWAGIKIYYVYA